MDLIVLPRCTVLVSNSVSLWLTGLGHHCKHCRTLDLEVCKVWELRVSSLWPIMRIYPNLREAAMEHIRNQV